MPRPLLAPLALALALGLLPAPHAVHAQEVSPRPAELELVDGTKLRGEILAETDQVITFRVDGVTRAYRRARIAMVRTITVDEPAADTPSEREARGATKPQTPRDAKRLSDEAAAWLEVLIARLDSSDAQVRGSVAKAIVALGPAVRGPLEQASDEASPAAADAIGRILAALDGRAAGRAGKETRRPETAPDEAMEAGAPPRLLADPGVRQAAERLRVELGLDESAADDVLEAVVEFRAGHVKLARAGERLDPDKLLRRRGKLVAKAVKRLSPHLDSAGTLLLRERLATWRPGLDGAARD